MSIENRHVHEPKGVANGIVHCTYDGVLDDRHEVDDVHAAAQVLQDLNLALDLLLLHWLQHLHSAQRACIVAQLVTPQLEKDIGQG